MTKEIKKDKGKVQLDLLPLYALDGVARVMEFGLLKGYKRDSWKLVPNGERRYLAALMRHLSAILEGQKLDEESKLPHIYHLTCDAIFLCYWQKQKRIK